MVSLNNYRTNDEMKYYGSDLNKFVALNCRKDMIVNNIDLVIYRYGNDIVRIIESKHKNESSSKSQMNLLKLLSMADIENKKIEVYVVAGDPPYENVDILFLNNDEAALQVKKDDFIKFLNFETNFEQLAMGNLDNG